MNRRRLISLGVAGALLAGLAACSSNGAPSDGRCYLVGKDGNATAWMSSGVSQGTIDPATCQQVADFVNGLVGANFTIDPNHENGAPADATVLCAGATDPGVDMGMETSSNGDPSSDCAGLSWNLPVP